MLNTVKSQNQLLWLVSIGIFMETLDSTIVNAAVPSMAASLGESALYMQSVVIAYSLDDRTFDSRLRLLARKDLAHAEFFYRDFVVHDWLPLLFDFAKSFAACRYQESFKAAAELCFYPLVAPHRLKSVSTRKIFRGL